MSLAQENFDRAVVSAQDTLKKVGTKPALHDKSPRELNVMIWDLEAIGAALRLELMNRSEPGQVDIA